jgi:CelD/BcsL family acetyltransferase involved in cellulose biosynthesis
VAMVNVKLFDDLDAVEQDAAGGLDRAAQPSLYARLDWFRLLARHCPPTGRLKVARAAEGERRAWLFLATGGHSADAYAAWYSLRVGPVGDLALLPHIAAALRRERLDSLNFSPVADAAPLVAALRCAGWRGAATPSTSNWIARTEGLSFCDYWASRPGQLRSTVKRKARAADLEITIQDYFDPESWADYEAVYRASWKPEEGSFPFLRALAQQEGAAGTLRLGIARKDGRPVAVQLWTVEHGEATIHKLAYAEDSKALSPGTILGMAMFRHAIDEDRVRLIDYGTGDDAYKRDWMDERRQLWRVTAYNPATLRGLAGAARAKAAQLVGRSATR